MDATNGSNTPKKPGKPGRPRGLRKTGGRKKGVPPKITQSLREVCREVLGLENLVIRKRLRRWFETGDAGGLDHGAGLGGATFRHIMLMGHGQVKHVMESGDKQRPSVVFTMMPEAGVHAPWCYALDRSRHPKSDIAIVHEGPCVSAEPNAIQAPPAKALVENNPPGEGIIDAKAKPADKPDEPEGETLESVSLPEPPEPFRDRGRSS